MRAKLSINDCRHVVDAKARQLIEKLNKCERNFLIKIDNASPCLSPFDFLCPYTEGIDRSGTSEGSHGAAR